MPQTTKRQNLLAWTLFCLVAGSVFVLYASVSRAGGQGEWLMPLDDVYIHFQYARQLALGQPYVYNPGQPATSGATSFLYPYILAFGYLIGFHDLALGGWAMIVGTLALLASMQAVYRLGRAANAPHWLRVLGGVTLGLTGSFAWHYMSGMETGLVCALALWTLEYFVEAGETIDEGTARRAPTGFVICATLLALIRPEASLMAVWASLLMAIKLWRHIPKQRLLLLLIPILALGIQPLVNILATGSSVASGNQSKSLFGLIPFDLGVVIGRIVENLVRMLREFFTGVGEHGAYVPFFIGPIALVTVIGMLISNKGMARQASTNRYEARLTALLILGWWGMVAMAAATLDTAFWHFKRYQMPIMVLFVPVAVWGIAILVRFVSGRIENGRPIGRPYSLACGILYTTTILLPSLGIFSHFLTLYAYNVGYVASQPLPMARWLAANTPPDAIVAVHDTGMMRYMGGRTTLDIVGLTTPGAADYWRNGPGAVAEFLMQKQPDYIASYGKGHGYGLGLLTQTSLYGDPLALFTPIIEPNTNVALAADTQGIYQPNYAPQARRAETLQTSVLPYLEGFTLVDQINVADIVSEKAHNYHWSNPRPGQVYPTDVLEATYLDCEGDCLLRDGGRHLTGQETFTLSVTPNQDVILVTRVNGLDRIDYNVYANDVFVGTRFVPRERGRWIDVPTLIPAALVTSETLTITIKVNSAEGDYLPYYHLVYQGMYTSATPPPFEPLVTFQEGAIQIMRAEVRLEGESLVLDLTWYTPTGAKGDYSVFLHVYPENAPESSQIAQTDMRPGRNALPPGNWLPGTVSDTMTVNLEAVPEGRYRVAFGLYDPVTFERLTPSVTTDEITTTSDGRVFLETVEIKR
jgi:hypothetical protein